ncbi:FAD:protein FMN transferase [Konateibacter massiliensis]|uniref:FAD:protein FMN transferase n=1 Tax=Konateibacter massiliensis TaxID=2002841 RepID=UPI000C15C191|nr:FAD:protein FMN transferase [Konateibacter massiliensis]
MKKIICLILTSCLIVAGMTACGVEEHYEESKVLMDTLVTLNATGKNAQKAVEESFSRIEEIESIASSTIEGSDVYQINDAAGNSAVTVHTETLTMIQNAVTYSELSDGAFDITVGPLIKLWGIHTDHERVPSDEEIKAALPLVDYHNIQVNEKESSVMLLKEGMSIDLGAVAKGFAADEVRSIFEKYEIKNALINLGNSTIYTIGKNSQGTSWGIGIANPRDTDLSHYFAIVRTSGEALSTSGDYERFFIQDGKRYHHILNPKTGYPADSGVMSTTIVTDGTLSNNSMLADILSTVVFVLGKDKGIEFVESLDGVSCAVTGQDYKLYTSEGFDTRIENLNSEFEFAD